MADISTIQELNNHFGALRRERMELWISAPEGQSLCALVSGDVGWLMYLRNEGDAGFSTRNPNYQGPSDKIHEYELENGQADHYPASWALPIFEVQKAIEHFIVKHEPAPWLVWNNDSGDGVVIGRQKYAKKV